MLYGAAGAAVHGPLQLDIVRSRPANLWIDHDEIDVYDAVGGRVGANIDPVQSFGAVASKEELVSGVDDGNRDIDEDVEASARHQGVGRRLLKQKPVAFDHRADYGDGAA